MSSVFAEEIFLTAARAEPYSYRGSTAKGILSVFPFNQARKSTSRFAAATVAGTILTGLGIALTPATASAAPSDVWDRVAACESSGRWSINTGNGYYGGLQFSRSTWKYFGGQKYAPTADKATKAQQIEIAQRTLAVQGPGAWPVCSKRAGLTRANGGATTGEPTPTPTPTPKPQPKPAAPNAGTYQVKWGDTLSRIARTHRVHGGYRALAAYNKIPNPDVIYVGQVLRIPA